MVVLGAPKHVRSSYRLWEEPKAPDFVLEIASRSNYRIDLGDKHDLYAGLGVTEYWQCDPAGGHLNPPLLGFRLVGRRYVPISVTELQDGTLTGRSGVLGLDLHLTPRAPVREALRFFDPARGEPLRSLREAEGALEEAEARLQEERMARQALEAELQKLRRRGG